MKPAPVTEADHVVSPDRARLTLVEYGDFECPFCVQAFHVIEPVRQRYGAHLRFVFRHVMRAPDQGYARQAAEASEFAASHGRFWEMYRQLFMHPDAHELDDLVGYAAAIGLSAEECRSALVERRFAPLVRDLATAAIRSGIIGTPMLFIDGQRYQDRLEEPLLVRAIEGRLGSDGG